MPRVFGDEAGLFWFDEIVGRTNATRILPPLPENLDWQPTDEYPSLEGQGIIAIDCETKDPELKQRGPGARRDGRLIGVAVGTEAGFRRYYPFDHEQGPNLDKTKVLSWLARQLQLPVPKIGANLLYDLDYLTHEGLHIKGPFYDIQIAEPLLDETQLSYSLNNIAKRRLGETKTEDVMVTWLRRAFGNLDNLKGNIYRAPPTVVGPYAESDVDLPLRIFKIQRRELEAQGLWDLFILESKLLPLLLTMRQHGVRVDLDAAQQLSKSMDTEIQMIRGDIKHKYGSCPDIWASAQLARMYDSLHVTYPRTERTNAPSFRKDWLMYHPHQFSKGIQRLRVLDKLKSTFVDGTVLSHHVKGRIHCQFNQLRSDAGGTVSGRFSCVAGWTKIKTIDGNKFIIDVRPGDLVWTHKQRWRPVTHVWRKGHERMLRLHLSNGNILTCTTNHRLLSFYDRWMTAGEIHGYFQKVYQQFGQHQKSTANVSQSRIVDYETNSQGTTSRLWLCSLHYTNSDVKQRTSILEYASLFSKKNWRQKSDVWQDCRETSQLEGALFRSEGLLNYQTKWQKSFSTSRDHGQSPWVKNITEEIPGTSFRWQWREQRPEQSRPGNQQRTQYYTRLAAPGGQTISIAAIETGGSYEVFDITVAEDESYEACGVFQHNSTHPNLQQIPIRDEEFGDRIRSLFIPEEGHVWCRNDWSQIEYRLIASYAALTRQPGIAPIIERYRTDPTTDYHQAVADLAGISRAAAKTLNFGLAYGEGVEKLCAQLGLNRQQGEILINEYHRRAPFIRPLARMAMARADQQGQIRTLAGRRRRFTAWEYNGQFYPAHLEHAMRSRINQDKQHNRMWAFPRRAYTHKALNALIQGSAADIMKTAMAKVWEAGLCDVLVPHLTVHDELDVSMPPTNEGREAARELKHIMVTSVELQVPMIVDQSFGRSWGETK